VPLISTIFFLEQTGNLPIMALGEGGQGPAASGIDRVKLSAFTFQPRLLCNNRIRQGESG
jgi:hypothetical protein